IDYISWKSDFKKYPELIKQIEEIFRQNQVDENTVDYLSTNYLWEVSRKPEILVFNLYLLREVEDRFLRPNFANVTEFTAIAYKTKKEWLITIVNSIFDVDMEMDVRFKNGHKRYIIWDFYKYSKGNNS